MAEQLTVQQQLADQFDEILLKQVRENPTAAVLNVARQRCLDMGYTKPDAPKDAIEQLVEELKLDGDEALDVPPVTEMGKTSDPA